MDTEKIIEILGDHLSQDGATEGIEDIKTFEEAGLLTNNQGLVLRIEDGSEFQISIIQSK